MKLRADLALVARGLAGSREKAQAFILAGQVYVDERRVDKASEQISDEDNLVLRDAGENWASRGALKLEVTEGDIMRDTERAAEVLQSLKDVGASLALVGIGTLVGAIAVSLLAHRLVTPLAALLGRPTRRAILSPFPRCACRAGASRPCASCATARSSP